MSIYRGRIAPTPTGYMHLGHARTFRVAQKRAQDGVLVLRNEDLDRHRCKPEFTQAMLEDLRWIGLAWQEGPDVGGPFAPYTQSERLPLYETALRRLLSMGLAYACTCSRKDLMRIAAPHAEDDDEPVYDNHCRPAPGAVTEFAENVNYRFRVPDGEVIRFADGNLGEQLFTAGQDFGDFLVWRKDGLPSYQLACTVDDAAMQITEVVRGRDLLKSTARQMLLQNALGYPTPAYFHTELMLDEDGQRLAKRHDALSLRMLRAGGITPAEILTGFQQ
ncbi:tRNA glutamyl-Q(34) synthetase GluQRS [Terriglobus tenax]|uniref:tRNA glutamyl-Q(34) synthetase GluQRS n=1 Tax=Terriglobus tenax TaxID=1111115 RepID=UPI0021E0001B|nr:tRNA glutamyl-Q(34) synthetase GluQRS [Terriglobus tenax]